MNVNIIGIFFKGMLSNIIEWINYHNYYSYLCALERTVSYLYGSSTFLNPMGEDSPV